MRTLLVVILSPLFDFSARVVQTGEPIGIQTFIPQSAVKAFYVGILHRLAWLNELQPHTVFLAVVFAGKANDPASAVHILDLKTGKVSTLPGSQGLFSPRWSPDGRYIPALSGDEKALSMFDLQTQKWVQLTTGTISWLNWSKDGKYLIVYDGVHPRAVVLKVRLSDHKVEPIADLKNFATTGRYGYSLTVAPDDSPLLLRDAGTYDVYSLDWQEP